MKKFDHFFNRSIVFFLSTFLVVTILTGCSQDNKNQTAEEDTPEETVQEPASTPQEDIQADNEQPEMQEEETQVAEQPASASRPQVSSDDQNNTVIKGVGVSYKEWDGDADGILNKEEFYNGFYKVWDNNGDNSIDQNEFDKAVNDFFANYNFKEYGKFGDWDADSNNKISDKEFRDGMVTILDSDQTAGQLLVVWDLDNDDKIEKVELDNVTVMLDQDDN